MSLYPPQSAWDIRGTPLLECERVEIGDNTVLYWRANGDTHGFDFFVAEFASAPGVAGGSERYMELPDTQVECLCHGTAYFDGLRHLYMGSEASDNEGYLYYVSPKTLVAVFSALEKLEAEHCPFRD